MTEQTIKKSVTELTQPDLFQQVGEICAVVNTVVNAKELLEISLKRTMDLFGAKRGSIFILKENGRDLILKIAQGITVSEQETLVKRMGEGIVGRVAESKKPIFVDDISTDERFRGYKARGGYQTPSFICTPLLIKDTLIGVINITDKGSGKRFTSQELQLLDFIATQIALNYRRIQLYQKFKHIIKESQDLKDKLGKSSQEASHLKKQVVLHEKLATIGKLAGGIAHEFNNPLDGVMRYTNLCLEGVNDEVVRGYLLEIKYGLNRMATIVKNLLACSRQAAPTMRMIKPRAAVEQVIRALQVDVVHKNVRLSAEIADDVPQIIDLGFDQIFSNLLRNAIDAVEKEGNVQVKGFLDGGMIVFEVHDDGCGIPTERIENVFEPFYTTKDIDKGCGLGLTIVSEIIKNYNGQISVQSTPGRGTTFCVKIPVSG